MPRRILLNAAMIPEPGTWRYTLIDPFEARKWLQDFTWESYIGYPQTAEYLTRLAGRPIPLNRAKVENLRPGDEALVCRLRYRVADPATKGQPQPEDWEFGIITKLA